MIVANNLKKEYKSVVGKFFKREKKYFQAVSDISIKLEKGKIVGVLGVNGAGKTTLIKMLSSLIEPTSGTIHMDDIDIVKNPYYCKRNINLITGGERNIYWRLTGRENLEYFGSLYNIEKKKLDERINSILEVVKLTDKADELVEKYSKGMKQRLQIARGLINDPEYILLDEPTLGLDIIIGNEIRRYIKEISKDYNKGILLTTHYIEEAEELCDYIYIINHGKVITEGTVDEIKKLYSSEQKVQITVKQLNTEQMNIISDFSSNLGIKIDNIFLNTIELYATKDKINDFVFFLNNNNIEITELIKKNQSLEKIMFELVSSDKNE